MGELMARQLLVMVELFDSCEEDDIITFGSQPLTEIRNVCLSLFSQVQASIK